MKKYTLVILLGIITGYLLVKLTTEENQIQDSYLQQSVIESQISPQNLSINKLIEHLSTNTELIILEESGASEISYSRSSNSIFKWCSQSDITLHANYKLIISIPTNSIQITKQNNEVLASFSERDFQIKAIELNNKVINRDKDLFGKTYSDNELIVLETMLKDKIKSNAMNQETYNTATESLKVYLTNLAEDLDIKINF